MAKKVVKGNGMFFKDEIQIIDVEVEAPLTMPPSIPVFARDELQILYNGRVYVASKDKINDDLIKVYTMTFGLKEVETPKEQEDKYFADNKAAVDNLKQDFIERSVNGISVLDTTLKGKLGPQINSELVEKIMQAYSAYAQSGTRAAPPGKGIVPRLDDDSVFNSYMKDCERIIILDRKVYQLLTIPEFISQQRGAFEPSFYSKLQAMAANSTPEEVSKLLEDNSELVHRKALPMIKNKIWHSHRSFKLCLDGAYWVPDFKENGMYDIVGRYVKLLERKIKTDAAKEYI